jgi:hypothetical protein
MSASNKVFARATLKKAYWPLINTDERGFRTYTLVLFIRVYPCSSAANTVFSASYCAIFPNTSPRTDPPAEEASPGVIEGPCDS